MIPYDRYTTPADDGRSHEEVAALPLLGTSIPWGEVAGLHFRVKYFTASAKIENGTVKCPSLWIPYALVHVESPLFPNDAILPICHKLDFHNLWRICKERCVADYEELIVCYTPAKGFAKLVASFTPRLTFLIHGKGHLERVHDPKTRAYSLVRDPIGWLYGLKGSIPRLDLY